LKRAQVLRLIGARNPWHVSGVDPDCERLVLTVTEAVTRLHTCWVPRIPFASVAANIIAEHWDGNREDLMQILSLAEAGRVYPPLMVLAWTHSSLQRWWSAQYPRDTSLSADALIVEDGNHRLSACALQLGRGESTSVSEVEVYLVRM
jgi:hypothetical protein